MWGKKVWIFLLVFIATVSFSAEKVSTPIVSVESGTYDFPQFAFVNVETPGAVVYYTTDGTDPLTSSTRRTLRWYININTSMTLKVAAVKNGMEPSDVVTYNYLIRVMAPKVSPGAGEWKQLPEKIVLSTTTPGATIYYTTDGSEPTRHSNKYTDPIILERGKLNVIKAIAVKDDGSPDSYVATFEYRENPNLILLTDVLKPNANIDYVIEKVILEMTLDEKVRMVWGAATSQLGAAGNTYAIPRLGITSMELADGPAGLRLGMLGSGGHEATAWPNPMMLASTWNEEIVEKIGAAIASEAKYYGIDIMLGPGMNIHRDPLGGRVFEYYSEDPHVTGKIAAAWIKGLQENGVGATMKHYAANNAENNRMNINEIISERALREIYLRGYEIAIEEADPWAAMGAYNKVNGTWCTENEYLNKMLKDVFGFKGLLMSDWGAYHNPVAYKYGFDLNTPGGETRLPGPDSLKEAINQGIISQKDLDRAIAAILKIVIKTDTFKKQIYDKSVFAARQKLDPSLANKHAALSKEAALEGIVLLKNDYTLPLKDVNTVALIGQLAYKSELPSGWGSPIKGMYFEGGGSAAVVVDFEEVVTLVEALTSGGLNVLQKTENGDYLGEKMSKKDAIYAAENSDVALILIGRPGTEGADNTPESMKLTEEEFGMIRNVSEAYHDLGKKVVVLLNVALPIEVDDWDDYVDAILYIGLPGTYGATAVTDILVGKTNPSGKLVDSWPVKYEYAPTYGTMPKTDTVEMTYSEDIYVGYRYYDLHPEKVKYPFGYGLSYTKFSYESILLSNKIFNISNKNEKITVTVSVRNIGEMAGKEVVQLYVRANDSSIARPYKELKGFAKTKLLNPGESEQITFVIDSRDLAYFDETVHEWIVEPGMYTIIVGGTSDNSVLENEGVCAQILAIRE
ncbi:MULTISPECIES: glycoside hydrolase family 3 C-terminal domain-containing protein [Pseudothermotoga]|uniref:Beta-glucosidase n=1 Tax=Pseudothermotoga lettingae (strain ATCC BAA-301 / DSM 14385 / NBRC 107922 / TMO) TaxID=416591 RepID=A8F618_PSELT|nr:MULTISPECIES: glycoside hydrolase family 3 C-terminal domain-containing protein [Pseudothermotoga]ABV33602.1 Beta-glucosidase [Pseudothermotoga lettingae TMO]MDI3495500.1 beta-glucosidase [Pseudothermotoga sp.]MDK2883750.1 beta-glucosidase [Pseudothermotoga sp.]GLI49483.1 glycosyl hydrolase [Pseudothermotoga lettingae TMO]